MPPDAPREIGSPRDWLRSAQGDLALARLRKTRGIQYEHLCFHAQQAAEKALKALLLAHGIALPRTHDLAFLVGALPPRTALPPPLIDLPILSKYAVQHRYPGDPLLLTAKHRAQALSLAEQTVMWVARLLGTP